MPLCAGDKVGPYEILAPIGAGGMGEVYRARDTTLKRDIALKVLPGVFARDPDRMGRFHREAEVLASLNHANIAHLYGIEERALVMELVEGQTLPCPSPVEAALDYARQIAEALEYAHERGVVHRDLKPANVKITSEGLVKVLDFGLAKVLEDEPPASSLANSPTLTLGHTRAGMILGTAAYMSPEQAVGRPVDRRSDIFSFGVVLYELLSGQRAFAGATTPDVLEAVVKNDPDWSKLPADTPESVRKLLRRCLTKDRKQRLQAIGEARIILSNPLSSPSAQSQVEEPAAAARPASRPAKSMPWVVLATVAALAVVFAALWLRVPARVGSPIRFPLDRAAWLSPDGRLLLSQLSGGRTLQVRGLGEGAWKDLPDTTAANLPFWSEDSSAVGFFAEGRLKVVGIDGKSPVRDIAPAPDPAGGTWRGGMANGKIVFAAGKQLYEIDLAGGTVRDLHVPLESGGPAIDPAFLPEGDAFVFLGLHGQRPALLRARLSNPQAVPERLLDTPDGVVFGRNPHTGNWHVFYNGGSRTVFTAPIDPKTGVAIGPAVQVLDGISTIPNSLMAFGAGSNGTVTWRQARVSLPIWRLRWFDRGGAVLGTVSDPARMLSVELSPDETRAAVEQGVDEVEIWMYNLQRGTGTRFSTLTGVSGTGSPLWAPDGSFVYYEVSHAGSSPQPAVVRQPAAGSNAEVVMRAPKGVFALSLQAIAPDGRSLIIEGSSSEGSSSLQNLLLRGDLATGAVENLLPEFDAGRIGAWARITPDGRWLLFSAGDVSGGLYAVPYPPQRAEPRLVTTTSSESPFLSKDGRWLYSLRLTSPAGITMQPIVSGPATLRIGDPVFAFPMESTQRVGANIGAISRDGSRILAIAGDATDQIQTQVLTDWTVLLGGAQK
jgi:eukaryotic-like serine/threonine-protein kinase